MDRRDARKSPGTHEVDGTDAGGRVTVVVVLTLAIQNCSATTHTGLGVADEE
jgi:hypothetical protein